jgi:hypothetical protein
VTFLLVAVIAAGLWIVVDAGTGARTRAFAAWSLVTVMLAIGAAPLLLATGLASNADVGTIQRVSLGALNLWLLVLAVRQLRTT